MNKGTYLLSICIPTYNREKYLKRLLDSIIVQKWFSDEVEIIVDDWPSTDHTEQLVKEYQKKHKNIKYFRNDKAIWMLPALLEAISFSNWKYTWLFGSDDFMQKDVLEIVLNTIKKKKPTLILSNRADLAPNEKPIDTDVDPKVLSFNWFADFSQYMWLHRHEDRWDQWNYLTFMSVCCFETAHYKEMLDYVLSNVCNLQTLHKHYFHYALIVFSELSSDKKICIVESPRLVFCQEDNHGWKPNKKIAQDLDMLLSYLKHNYAISKDCHKLFTKISRIWWFTCFVVPAAKDFLNTIWLTSLNNYLSRLWRNFFKK